VLDTLARIESLSGVLVVTRESEARAMATARGFDAIADEETGLNAAVTLGLARAAAAGSAALVAPGDIPFLAVSEAREILRTLACFDVALAPAARDGGTNLLALSRPDQLAPAFGPDSAARHLATARARGLSATALRLPGAALDLDIPADLGALPERGAPRTRAALALALEGASP
jgi:2-phospho-L-lactate/phosphoenolpyruvate guanylyltransferase